MRAAIPCGLSLSLLTRRIPRSQISSWKCEGEERLRGPFVLPSQLRILTCAADDGPCFASFFPRTRAIYRTVRTVRAVKSDRQRSRVKERERKRDVSVLRIKRSRSARSERIDTSRYPRRSFSRCARKTDESSPTPVPRLVLHVSGDARTDSNTATRRNRMTRTEPIGRKSP